MINTAEHGDVITALASSPAPVNTIQSEAASDLQETIARIEVLDREIGMLKNAQRYLRGCAASQNRARIADREEELATWVYLMGVQERLVA